MESMAESLKKRALPKINRENFDGLKIRPSKKETRLFVDNEYFASGYGEYFPKNVSLVYFVLAKYANFKTQTCFPSFSTIMKEAGIKNRNSAVNAIKILEAYSLIAANHSKGKYSNRYAMLDICHWRKPNSITIDTILKVGKNKQTVSMGMSNQYQKDLANGIPVDTRNHLNKSSNEIKDGFSFKEEDGLNQLLPPTKTLIRRYFQDGEIIAALKFLRESNPGSDKKFGASEIMRALIKQGVKPKEEVPSWLGGGSLTNQ